MEVTGYAEISSSATSVIAKTPEKFIGKIVRVIEFSKHDDGAMVMSSDAEELATVDKKDIKRSFECAVSGILYITAPNLDPLEQMAYVSKCMMRKGGYSTFLKHMVIQASLSKGTFTDGFLWAKQ